MSEVRSWLCVEQYRVIKRSETALLNQLLPCGKEGQIFQFFVRRQKSAFSVAIYQFLKHRTSQAKQ